MTWSSAVHHNNVAFIISEGKLHGVCVREKQCYKLELLFYVWTPCTSNSMYLYILQCLHEAFWTRASRCVCASYMPVPVHLEDPRGCTGNPIWVLESKHSTSNVQWCMTHPFGWALFLMQEEVDLIQLDVSLVEPTKKSAFLSLFLHICSFLRWRITFRKPKAVNSFQHHI